jgi:hypothetical protein
MRTDSAKTERIPPGPKSPSERSDDMNEKHDEIAQLTILARTANPQELCATSNSP